MEPRGRGYLEYKWATQEGCETKNIENRWFTGLFYAYSIVICGILQHFTSDLTNSVPIWTHNSRVMVGHNITPVINTKMSTFRFWFSKWISNQKVEWVPHAGHVAKSSLENTNGLSSTSTVPAPKFSRSCFAILKTTNSASVKHDLYQTASQNVTLLHCPSCCLLEKV